MPTDYKKILVAVDIYAEYKPVIQRALSIAAAPLDLRLIYVSRPQIFFEPYGAHLAEDFSADIQKQAKAKMIKIAAKYQLAESQIHVPIGSPANEIHDFAQKIKADLIILGTHGQKGLKLLLGSTANAVLHGVKQDVLAVKV